MLLVDFKIGVTSAIFQTLAKESVVKELFISCVTVESMQGILSLSMRDVILSYPGALLEENPLMTCSTSFSCTDWNLNSSRLSINSSCNDMLRLSSRLYLEARLVALLAVVGPTEV
mgnify:CR=1 FL=1